MTFQTYLDGLNANNWNVSKGSMTEGRLVVTYHVPNGGQDTHTEQPGAEISGEDYYYRLQSVDKTDDARGGHDVRQTWTDALGVLDSIPCFIRQNLPSRAKAAMGSALRWGYTPLLYASDLLAAAAAAAAQAGFTITYPEDLGGLARIPFSGGSESVGSVLAFVLRWVPNASTRCTGKVIEVTGGGGSWAAGATYATASVKCSPDMKSGVLTVGSVAVNLAEVYAENAGRLESLNWYANCAALIAEKLAYCPEASAICGGNTIFLTAREPGADGNSITLSLTGTPAGGTAAQAILYPGELSEAGTLTDGETILDLGEATATNAKVSIPLLYQGGVSPEFGIKAGGSTVVETYWNNVLSAGNVQEWVAFLNSGEPSSLQGVARASVADDVLTLEAIGAWEGAAGNALVVDSYAPSPWEYGDYAFTGGSDEGGTRTLADLVQAINGSALASKATAEVADVPGGDVKASGSAEVASRTYYRCGIAIVRGGTSLATGAFTTSIRSLANLVEQANAKAALAQYVRFTADGNTLSVQAVEGGAAGNGLEVRIQWVQTPAGMQTIQLSGGGSEQGILLTAATAGAAGNDLNFTGAGCFGVVSSFTGGADGSGITAAITPFSGGSGSSERQEYTGLIGERPGEGTPPEWCITRHSVTRDVDTESPSCIVGVNRGGNVVFTIPENANPYTPGAYLIELPDDLNTQQDKASVYEGSGAGAVAAAVRGMNAQRENVQPWMMVKGWKLPAGWIVGAPGTSHRERAANQEAWRDFWCRFSAFEPLKRVTGNVVYGRAIFYPLTAQDAYPETEDTPAFDPTRQIGGGVLGPSIKEESNVPANYKVLAPSDNVHLLIDGSFPASSKARGNVSGLKFCRGTLRAYVWTTGKVQGITAEEADQFFEGTCKVDGHMRRYTCLELKDAVFINRARKRYQTGTNRLAPGDPDYNADRDGGRGWWRIAEEEEEPQPDPVLTRADYMEAAREYWAACQAAGGNGVSHDYSLAKVQGFNAAMTPDDILAALQITAPQGSISYDAGSRTLDVTASTSSRDVLGIDDLLSRRKAEKEAAWVANYEREEEERAPREQDPAQPLTPAQIDAAADKASYPQVSPNLHPAHGIGKAGIPLNPFQIYAEGGHWYMNEGVIASPVGPLVFETQDITALWARNRAFFVKPHYNRSTQQYEAKLFYKTKS